MGALALGTASVVRVVVNGRNSIRRGVLSMLDITNWRSKLDGLRAELIAAWTVPVIDTNNIKRIESELRDVLEMLPEELKPRDRQPRLGRLSRTAEQNAAMSALMKEYWARRRALKAAVKSLPER
jgi:hypothetical protein